MSSHLDLFHPSDRKKYGIVHKPTLDYVDAVAKTLIAVLPLHEPCDDVYSDIPFFSGEA